MGRRPGGQAGSKPVGRLAGGQVGRRSRVRPASGRAAGGTGRLASRLARQALSTTSWDTCPSRLRPASSPSPARSRCSRLGTSRGATGAWCGRRRCPSWPRRWSWSSTSAAAWTAGRHQKRRPPSQSIAYLEHGLPLFELKGSELSKCSMRGP